MTGCQGYHCIQITENTMNRWILSWREENTSELKRQVEINWLEGNSQGLYGRHKHTLITLRAFYLSLFLTVETSLEFTWVEAIWRLTLANATMSHLPGLSIIYFSLTFSPIPFSSFSFPNRLQLSSSLGDFSKCSLTSICDQLHVLHSKYSLTTLPPSLT